MKCEKNTWNYSVYYYVVVFIVAIELSLSSCNELGNEFLSSPPTLDYTIDSVFKSEQDAERLLTNMYATLPYPLSLYYQPYIISQDRTSAPGWQGTLMSLTDLAFCHYSGNPISPNWYTGNINATTGDFTRMYKFRSGLQWKAFYEGWTLINNLDKVPDMDEATKKEWKAEAKTIMAFHYIVMFRLIGGIVWVNHAYTGNDTIPREPRLTVLASVDSICNLLNQAIVDLPLDVPQSDLGRMTKAGAAGLKTRLLLFAASPLMNNDKPYLDGEAAEKHLIWTGGYKPGLWERAKKAAEQTIQFIDQSSYYHMVEPKSQDSASYRLAYRDGYFERGSGETLISLRISYNPPRTENASLTAFGNWAIMNCPTETFAEMFPDKNGVPLESSSLFDPKHPYEKRDPRFYETLTSNGSQWGDRKAELWIGGRDRPSVKYGPATGGYLVRKYVFNVTKSVNETRHFSYLRIPEIYLSYAEILNRINKGPTPEAFEYVNKVRHRVGLKDLQDIMEDPTSEEEFQRLIVRERVLELGFENVRWYDIVRNKRKDIFEKKLKGLNLYKEVDGSYRRDIFNVSDVYTPRVWEKDFNPKWYLESIPQEEVNKNYGLIQNPGW